MDPTHFLAAPRLTSPDMDAFYETYGKGPAVLWTRLLTLRPKSGEVPRPLPKKPPLFARRAFGV